MRKTVYPDPENVRSIYLAFSLTHVRLFKPTDNMVYSYQTKPRKSGSAIQTKSKNIRSHFRRISGSAIKPNPEKVMFSYSREYQLFSYSHNPEKIRFSCSCQPGEYPVQLFNLQPGKYQVHLLNLK